MSLFTLVSSLLHPTVTAPRVQRQWPRTRLNLEALEDRRLLSHGFGLDDVQQVEVERPEPAGDTPSVGRGLDDNTLQVRTLSNATSSASRGLDDNLLAGVSDRRGRGNEGETGVGRRHGQGNGQPAKSPKARHHRRHHVGERVIRVIHA